MEVKTINILVIEDNTDDVFLLRTMLQKVTDRRFELHHIGTLASGLTRLAEGNVDVVLLESFAAR